MRVLNERERERRVRNKERGMGEKKEKIYMRGERYII